MQKASTIVEAFSFFSQRRQAMLERAGMEKEKKAPDFDYAQSPVHIWLLSAVEAPLRINGVNPKERAGMEKEKKAPDFDYAQSPVHIWLLSAVR